MSDKINSLAEYSESYYRNADIYKMFSDAEDKEGLIWHEIKSLFVSKDVLDLGCGNGRYLKHLKEISNCIGVDQSIEQFKQSEISFPFVAASGSALPFKDESFDCVLSTWVWGTILDLEKREKLFEECKRVLRNFGRIILVENDTPSEFEYYRGRHLNRNTQDYNDWILNNGFKPYKQLETFIDFKNVEQSAFIFKGIWGDRLFAVPENKRIQNNVIIFEYKKRD